MSKMNKYVLNTKFKNNFINNSNSFDNQFHDIVKKTDVSSETIGVERISDATGLDRAYKDGDTHLNNKTLYIAGTHTLQDAYDDVTKIPFWGSVTDATRYKAAEKVINDNPQIENIVGHSLAGSVALELQKQYPDRNLKVRTYGAPVFDPLGLDRGLPFKTNTVERYSNYLDPVSYFDASTQNSIKWNPFDSFSLTHNYNNIASDKFIEEDYKGSETSA